MPSLIFEITDSKNSVNSADVKCQVAFEEKDVNQAHYSLFLAMALSEHVEKLIQNKESEIYQAATMAYSIYQNETQTKH